MSHSVGRFLAVRPSNSAPWPRAADRAWRAGAEYAFHHPLIRAVAYGSQLKSDRAEVHRRLTAGIESGSPALADQNVRADHRTSGGRR